VGPGITAEIRVAHLLVERVDREAWRAYEGVVPRTSDALATWWSERASGRAVLILDALSLREVPWLLEGAQKHGYTVHQARATGAELPADTTPFAKALGYASRSSLQNNGASRTGRLTRATTDATELPWEDCAAQITTAPDWVLWHEWPDTRLHDLGAPGHGLAALAKEAAEKLRSESFWILVHRLTTGRRLIITADHGYAASGHFDEEAGGVKEAPPVSAEPFTRQFLRLFDGAGELPRDQMQKFLRGTGLAPSDFETRGWCREENKAHVITPLPELARAWQGKHRRGMTSDYDQAAFLIGACFDNSGINATDTLSNDNFKPHPALGSLLEWFTTRGVTSEVRNAASRSLTILRSWRAKHEKQVQQMNLFFDDQGAS
jgi:hypothetical protein